MMMTPPTRTLPLLAILIIGLTLSAEPSFAGSPLAIEAASEGSSDMMGGGEMTFEYEAHTEVSTGDETRLLTIRATDWSCKEKRCTKVSQRPMPSLAACKALVREVGPLTLYGRPGKYLSERLLKKCNRVAVNSGVTQAAKPKGAAK